jgi:glycogen(starch) synthase
MQILFLSNFYPPAESGGYTQLCQEVREMLLQRGHRIEVVTSNYRARSVPGPEPSIHRMLHLESDDLFHYHPVRFFTTRRCHELHDIKRLGEIVCCVNPDVVMVWGMWALSKTLPHYLERIATVPVVYYVSDLWPADPGMHLAYWNLPARHRFMRLPKRCLAWLTRRILEAEGQPVHLRFDHVICVSAAVRSYLVQAGLRQFENARIIHNGIEVKPFLEGGRNRSLTFHNGTLRLLYAGRLVHQKGVHTAIEALAELAGRGKLDHLHLTVVGQGSPDYCAWLHKLVSEKGLQNYVTFRDAVPREQMPKLMQDFDVLVLPSICYEALARVPMEAMAAGLIVVGTTTGGTKELLVDGVNGLTFEPEDASGLARQIERLMTNPELGRTLAEQGRATVLAGFTLERMVDEIETFLEQTLNESTGR